MSARLLLIAVAISLFATSAQAADPTGRWLTADAAAVIQIDRCGAMLCGRIVGVTKDHPDDPAPVDAHGRPQCGQVIITDMTAEHDNLWRGRIADPRNDRVYSAEMWLGGNAQLRLRGYLGIPLFGQTQDWSRFSRPIGPACDIGAPSSY